MKTKSLVGFVAAIGITFASSTLCAQDLSSMSATGKEHEWLKKFVGDWEMTSDQGTAEMESSMLGKLWVVNESDMEIQGQKMKSIQLIGYNPEKKKFVGIWADSMVNHMWHYEGTLDESGNKLMLDAEGPSMSGDGSMANFRDAYEFTDDDTIVATSYMQGEDGEWTVLMEGTAKRKKDD